jgi:methionyl-tRNA formyltransferase
MRVLLFTAEEPLYLPRYAEPILAAHGDVVEGVVLAGPERPAREQARRQYAVYGPRAGARMAARYARGRLLDTLPAGLQRSLTGRYHSVATAARAHDVRPLAVEGLSDPAFLDRVREIDPDVLLSVVCGQRVPGPVLEVPEWAINVHGSLLPNYRGRATAFWPLYHGEERSGVTAHLMTPELDAGPIVERRSFPLRESDTVDDVMERVVGTGADLAVDLLSDLRAGETLDTEPNPTGPEDYYSLPTAAERREFRRRGGRFL